MQINCDHGFFTFTESKSGQIARFQSLFDLKIVRENDSFVFDKLKNAKLYSIKGNAYLGAIANVTHEGLPSEIFKANSLVYNFSLDLVVQITTISNRVILNQAGFYFISTGLILPGSITEDSKRVTDYSAWYSFERGEFKYSEVTRV